MKRLFIHHFRGQIRLTIAIATANHVNIFITRHMGLLLCILHERTLENYTNKAILGYIKIASTLNSNNLNNDNMLLVLACQ